MVNSAAHIALVFILLSGFSCVAGMFYDPEAGGNAAINTADQDQEHPRMIPDGSGNAILVWSDQKIHAQKIDDSMRFLWGADGVVVTTADGWQERSEICSDGAGGVIVVWEDCRGGVDNRDIYVQRITASGAPAWTLNGISLTDAAGDQTSPAIVAWQSGDFDLDTMDIYVQRIDPQGVALWTAGGVAVCTAPGDQCAATICADGAAGAILAWKDLRDADSDIYAQRVDADGGALWTSNGVPVCTADGDQDWLVAASDGQGGAVFAWEDTPFLNSDIYAQRVGAGGAIQWNPDGVPICTLEATQWDPRIVAVEGSGGAVIAWTDFRNQAHWYGRDLLGDYISAAGEKR